MQIQKLGAQIQINMLSVSENWRLKAEVSFLPAFEAKIAPMAL